MKVKKNGVMALLFVVCIALLGVGVYFAMPTIYTVFQYALRLFMPFLLGLVFAMAVNPLANLLQKKLKIPRGFSAVLVMVLIIGLLGGLLTFLVSKLISEGRDLYTQIPEIYENAKLQVSSLGDRWNKIYVNLPDGVQNVFASMGNNISEKVSQILRNTSEPMMDYAERFARAIPNVFVAVVVFLLSSYFMVTEHKSVNAALKKLFKPKLTERLRLIKKELKSCLGGYLKAQLILMAIAFAIIFIGLSVLNIKYALLIALGIALIDALPFFGSGLILWPWALIAFLNGNIAIGIGTLVIYIAVTVMRRFAEPKLISTGMGMHPILTLMSMYIGYKIFGVGGLILGPILLIIIISFYRAGVFDPIIRFIKMLWDFIKRQCRMFKKFFIRIMESDWDE